MHEAILNSFHTFKSEALRTNHQQTICWQHECLQKLPSKCSTVVFIIHYAAEFTYPTTIYSKFTKWSPYDVDIWFEPGHFNQKLGAPFWISKSYWSNILDLATLLDSKGGSAIWDTPSQAQHLLAHGAWYVNLLIHCLSQYLPKKKTNHGEHVE